MTPDKARDLLNNFDRLLPFEAELAMEGAAKDMAAMIAGMRTEYGVEAQHPNGEWLAPQTWHDSPDRAIACVTAIYGRSTANRRIVRRYVTEPEVIE